jgi:hypothetical protein
MKQVTVEMNDTVYALLRTLSEAPAGVDDVILKLIDHAQQGVYRPGSWERGWLSQAFGLDWEQKLEPGDPYGRTDDERLLRFMRPRR